MERANFLNKQFIPKNVNMYKSNLVRDMQTIAVPIDENGVVKTVDDTASNFFSSVRTRAAIEPPVRYNKTPHMECVPQKLEMDYNVILNKPFFIKNLTWNSTAVKGTSLARIFIPQDILTNPLVEIPFKASVYFRAKISVVFQVAGTPMHSGLLIAAAQPLGSAEMWQHSISENQLMAGPHVFLSANEATPAVLEVPFYVNSKLAVTGENGTMVVPTSIDGNFAEVEVYVFNTLGVPTSGSTSLSISVHFMFQDLEFYVPHVDPLWVPQGAYECESFVENAKGFVTNVFDRITSGVKTTVSDAYDLISSTKVQAFDFIDSGRAWLKGLTGLHNPADATISTKVAVQTRQNTNVVDAPIQLEKLDPFSQFSHYTRDYTFDTEVDEMLLSEIISKPQYIGSFLVSTTNPEGTCVWSRPITPFQQALETSYTDHGNAVTTLATTSLFQNIHFLSRFWRGGMKLYIQSAMSNFHFVKLTIARNYAPDTLMINNLPDFDSVPNLMMETLEFTGHQVHTVKLPYASSLEQLPCSTDPLFNALQHGMYYIYVHQPLVVNGSIPTSVAFNIYVGADDDFQFFGYATRPNMIAYNVSALPTMRSGIAPVVNEELVKEMEEKIKEDPSLQPLYKIEALREYQVESSVETQEDLVINEHEQDPIKPTDLRPIVSVRDFTRRFVRAFYRRFTSQFIDAHRGTVQIDVAEMLGFRGQSFSGTPLNSSVFAPSNAHQIIHAMFLGYSGGARFKVSVIGTTAAEVYYVPPGFHSYNVDPTGGHQWRATAPLPSANLAPNGDPYSESNLGQYFFAERATNTYHNNQLLNPSPMQDRPNYVTTSANVDIGVAAAGFDRMPMANTMHEIEVPHMSPYRFVGDSTKGVLPLTGTTPFELGANNMGYLVVKFAQPVIYYPGVPTVSAGAAIEVFVATDDVGRAGYQVFAPTTVLPAVRVTNGANTNYYQVGPDSLRTANAAGYYPGISSAFASPASSIVPAFNYRKALYKGG